MTDKKCCENCRHLMQYYIWFANRFSAIECGHCINGANKRKGIKKTCSHVCDYWEPKEIREKEQMQKFQNILSNMAKRINQIAIYFERLS